MEDAWMAFTSCKAYGFKVCTEGLLPALCGVPRAIQAQFEFAKHLPVHLILLWHLNIHIPLFLGIKVRQAHVVNHDAAPSSPLGMCGCMADYDSQCLKWRRCGVQGIVSPYVELSAHQS